MKTSNDALFQAVLWRAAPVAAAVVEFSGGLGGPGCSVSILPQRAVVLPAMIVP